MGFFIVLSRLTKSESTDSLLSQASGSSRSHCAVAVTRKRSERSVSVAAVPAKLPGQAHRATSRAGSAAEPEASKPEKESRSQKHTRVKIYLVLSVKKQLFNFFSWDLIFKNFLTKGQLSSSVFVIKFHSVHLCE